MSNHPLELHGKELGNQYALHALRERRAAIAGELVLVERRVRYLRSALHNLDGTLAIFDPNGDPSKLVKKPYRKVKLFGAGKLNQLILDALRRGARPMTTREVRDSIVAEVGFGPDAAVGMDSRVRANLLYLHKVRGLVVKEGDRATATWAISSPSK